LSPQGSSCIWIRLEEKEFKLVATWRGGTSALIRIAVPLPADMGKQEQDRVKNTLQIQASRLLQKHVNPVLAQYLATPPQAVEVVKVRLVDRNQLLDALVARLPAAVGAAWGAAAEGACGKVLQEYQRQHGKRIETRVRGGLHGWRHP
jgi:hypothetical protein